MKPEKILVFVGMFLLLQGCYTQFATLQDQYQGESRGIAVDSTGEPVPDTVVVKERETCYWHRTFFGDWELRCYETNYPDEWYSYYHQPWWYNQSSYYFYDCSCPYHIMFNPHCEYCWYYCNKYHNHFFIHHIIDTGSTIGTGINTGSGKKSARPPIRPGSQGSAAGTGGGAVSTVPKKDLSVTETGVDNNSSQGAGQNIIVMPDESPSPLGRPSMRPKTAVKKKEKVTTGNEAVNVQKKGVLQESAPPPKVTTKEKLININNAKQEKQQQLQTDKEKTRKRRSLRGK